MSDGHSRVPNAAELWSQDGQQNPLQCPGCFAIAQAGTHRALLVGCEFRLATHALAGLDRQAASFLGAFHYPHAFALSHRDLRVWSDPRKGNRGPGSWRRLEHLFDDLQPVPHGSRGSIPLSQQQNVAWREGSDCSCELGPPLQALARGGIRQDPYAPLRLQCTHLPRQILSCGADAGVANQAF